MITYTLSQFASLLGVSVKTLQRWDREKILIAGRTVTNRRFYTDAHLAQARGISNHRANRKTVVYSRVSSASQKPDLANQTKTLESFCAARGIAVDEWVQEVGGGMNFKRKKFLRLIDGIVSGQIGTVVVAHEDRLARFGFPLIEHLCSISDCELIVMNSQSLSPEAELVDDLMTIVHCFSSRLYGLRNYRKSLKEALSDDAGAQDTAEPNA